MRHVAALGSAAPFVFAALFSVACSSTGDGPGEAASIPPAVADGGSTGDAARPSNPASDASASNGSVSDADAGSPTLDAGSPHSDAGSGPLDSGNQGSDSSGTLSPLGVPGNWTLIFDDEFSGSTLNTSTWAPYWFHNGSQQNQTTMESSNVSVSGGTLNLLLTSAGTGGLVSTNPGGGASTGFQFTYGFAEARMFLPGSGTEVANWPAWWTDGQSPWPTNGEMDVMEGRGGSAAYHFHDPSGGPGAKVPGNFTGWHTFGGDWKPGSVTYYYDGQNVGSITSGITSAPMYLILENSSAVGSPGAPSVQPATVQVDYVRVWQ